MARNVQLEKLLVKLRAEARISRNPAHNTNDQDRQIEILQRKQEWFWNDFDWPHLRVKRTIPIQAGQYEYALPDDLTVDRIEQIEIRRDREYRKLSPNISSAHYAACDTELGERDWPPRRWQLTENEMIEVWPIPDQNAVADTLEGNLRITGIRGLKPLVDMSDRADLDDMLLVLHAAAELLAERGTEDAELKLEQATKHYHGLRAQLSPNRVVTMAGVRSSQSRPRRSTAVYNR